MSDKLAVNAKGYNPYFDFDKQIRLINGNVTDVKHWHCVLMK
jgi:hypothetical protein